RAVVRSPHLAGLVRLNLAQCWDAGVEPLAGPTALQALRHLDLAHVNLRDPGLNALGRSALLGQLTSLSLAHNELQDVEFLSLPRACTATLTALPLPRSRLGPVATRALASAPLTGLRRLDLGVNSLEEEGAAALTQAPWLSGLRTLNLWRNFIGPGGVRVL